MGETTSHCGAAGREILLRPAAPSDLGDVTRLLEAAELPTAGVREVLRHFVVAEVGGRIVGTAGVEVHGSEGLLRSVAVDPGFRGHGLGRRLTEWTLRVARDAGLHRLYLLTTTAEDYFPRHGFRRIGRESVSHAVGDSVEFRDACPASAVVMALDLETARSGGSR